MSCGGAGHSSWRDPCGQFYRLDCSAVRLGSEVDDGEAGAGAVILKMIEREELADHIIVVTRWYGGVHLGGDRFAHIVTSVRAYLSARANQPK